MSPLVILGSGLAGYGLLRELRKRDANAPVTLISADDGRVYYKPNLSSALSQGRRAPAQLASETAAQVAAKSNATILSHTRVSAIDPAGRRLLSDSGEIPYGRLVLALGADPHETARQPRWHGDPAHLGDCIDATQARRDHALRRTNPTRAPRGHCPLAQRGRAGSRRRVGETLPG